MVSKLGGLSDPWVSFVTPPCPKEEAELYFLGRASKGASQMVLVIKDFPATAGDIRDRGAISGLGRSPRRRKWQPTPVFLPGESHGQRGNWWAMVHVVEKSQTRLKQLSTHTHGASREWLLV